MMGGGLGSRKKGPRGLWIAPKLINKTGQDVNYPIDCWICYEMSLRAVHFYFRWTELYVLPLYVSYGHVRIMLCMWPKCHG